MSDLETFRSREPNLALAKRLKVVVWILTGVVLLLVGMMREVTIELPEGMDLGFLPPVHASLNALAALALIVALVAIKGGKAGLHQRCVNTAMVLSGLFLLSYVSYHFHHGGDSLRGHQRGRNLDDEERAAVGGMRTVYLVILLSHIVLAALSLPFILMTYVYGYTAQFAKHRRMARRVFPVWLYVAVTGPACYLLLRPYY